MGCCSPTNTAIVTLEYTQEVDQAAVRLAASLEQAPEFQEFVRLARLINLDPDVKRIQLEVRGNQMENDGENQVKTAERLQAEFENLPAVQAYRKAEAAAKSLFHAVDEAISQAAGVPFAVNAKISGCG